MSLLLAVATDIWLLRGTLAADVPQFTAVLALLGTVLALLVAVS